MGYLEYAWSLSFKKDKLETKILIDPKREQPTLSRDKNGSVIVLPEPIMLKEEAISFLGYQFPAAPVGKLQVAKLFRACVFHLSAHVATSNSEVYSRWEVQKDNRLAEFSESLVEDAKVNAYIFARHPDKLVDIAFANSLAFKRLKSLGKIWNPATRVMTASLLQASVGLAKGDVRTEEWKSVSQVISKLGELKDKVLESFAGEQINLGNIGLKAADEIYHVFDRYGPVLEVPSLPHTERLEHCTLFPQYQVKPDDGIGDIFNKCLTALGGEASEGEAQQTMLKKAVEAEVFQVFDSWSRKKAKESKILGRYEDLASLTKFKSIGFPGEDYTGYLRAKAKTKSETRRLISSLMVGFDALDEDPRKMYGVLDLQEVIQAVASESPKTDVFMRDENIGKSYAWVILFDASKSMSLVSDDTRNLGICLAETAKEILIDSTSWGIYAFNDRFLILKDPTERYGPKIRARIGALRFEGLTYMPDALHLAGEFLKKRTENLKVVTILSDGWPYGYSNITVALGETLDFLKKASIVVIGVGVKNNRMENFFRVNCNVKNMRDLTKEFPKLFLEASRSAVGL